MRLGWFIVVCAASIASMVVFGLRAQHASIEASSASQRLTGAEAMATRVLTLRAQQQVVLAGEPPRGAVSEAMGDALRAVGCPSRVLRNVTPGPAQALPRTDGPARMRQSTRVTLQPIGLPDLGALLERWRIDQPVWIVSRIDVTPEAVGRGRAAGSDRFSVTLELTATYLAP